MAYKITYGRNTIKLTDKQHKQRIYNAHKGNVIALSEYINNRTFVKYKCLKHNYEWDGSPSIVMSGSTGCPTCQHDRRIEYLSDTLDSLKEKIFNSCGDEYKVLDNEYLGHNHKMRFMHYPNDGGKPHIVVSYPSRILTKKSGCPVCSGMQTSKGYNDIATTDPEIASWFLNKEESYIYSKSSNKKVDFKCPTCGHISHKLINQVSRDRDIRCPICKDGISYPNKFIFNSLLQIQNKLDFLHREYQPNWCKFVYNNTTRKGIYDIYFGINNKQYIIEMDGGFHNKYNHMSGQTVEESQYIDKQKDLLAEKHNIHVVRIDSNYIGFEDRYEYLRTNIENSELKDILPLSLIDFNEANIKSQKSLLIECCNLWDKGYKASEIIEELHIPECSVSTYLRTGQKYDLCHNYSARESYARSQGRKVVCVNTKEVFDTIKDAERYYAVDGIGNCCEGKTHSAGKHKSTNEKLFWLFYEDYEKLSDKDIEKFLSDKLKYEMTNDVFGKPVVCITTGEQFMTAMDASRKYNVADNGIRFCCQGRLNTSGRSEDGTPLRWVYWEDYIKMTNDEIAAIIHSEKSRIKKVVCLNTKVVFNSATIAGKWCGVGKNSIRRSALKERASGGRHPETGEKLQWLYYEDYIKKFDKSTLTPYRVGA